MLRSWRKCGLALAMLTINGCEQSQEGSLTGTWQMESGTYTDRAMNQTIVTDESERFSLKIMSSKHFAVVEMFKAKPDSLFFATVGTYSITGDKYIERYEASNVGYQVGALREFSYSLEGDRWTISTTEENMDLRETWVRVQQR